MARNKARNTETIIRDELWYRSKLLDDNRMGITKWLIGEERDQVIVRLLREGKEVVKMVSKDGIYTALWQLDLTPYLVQGNERGRLLVAKLDEWTAEDWKMIKGIE